MGVERDGDGTLRQSVKNLLDQSEALLDLADTQPDARVDIAGCQNGNGKVELVVGCIAGSFSRVEVAAAGAADESGRAVSLRQCGLNHAGQCGAILQRGGIVIELD